MPSFKYVGDSQRVFPSSGLVVNPGDVVDVCPDPNFFESIESDGAESSVSEQE